MDKFLAGYLEAALRSSVEDANTDQTFQDLGYTTNDLSPVGIKEATEDCEAFRVIAWHDFKGALQYTDAEHLGQDFWLTRNGHGTGFWDRSELPEYYRKRLTDLAEMFGPAHPYLDTAGRIYFERG